ncbi:MAG TPA: IS110 family transposase [Gammaproteobacteria bacterium]|nr:IS110 family transposase [Gammaproteobacteria bacterium]
MHMQLSGGLDWGSERHAVCVVDAAGKSRLTLEPAHDAAGLESVIKRLSELAPAAELPIAIERPSGLVVDTLVKAGHPVVPIHPNVVKASRPRYRAAGGKHDRGDAYLLADLLRTDGHRFRPLTPQSAGIKALRAQVRARDDLLGERIALANQLRSLLESFWPGAAKLFCEIDSPIALAFLRRYPTPHSAAHLGEKRLSAFLAQEHYTGRKPATELLARLRGAAAPVCSQIEAQTKGELVKALARILDTLVVELTKLTARIEREVQQLDDGRLLMSFPRAGKLNAAQILAELGDVRERFQTHEQLAAEAGACPVTRESGKFRGVGFRWACNHRLRTAVTTWADNSRHASAWAADIYARARARGCHHPHAIRILARA